MAKPDPFLKAFQVAPRCFDISGRYEPASIRDQTLRAYHVVERLFEQGVLEGGSRLLVAGAGIAGATAAVQAAEWKAFTWLVEKQSWPFHVQRGVLNRFIDPYQYDWPLVHSVGTDFPARPEPRLPFPWKAAHASEIANSWASYLAAAQTNSGGRLQVHLRTTLEWILNTDRARDTKIVDAQLRSAWAVCVLPFEAILICTGFGRERNVGHYQSPPFWDNSQSKSPSPRGRYLISGGGDGALQDFLLATTGEESARSIFAKIFDKVVPAGERALIERKIESAEDQANRALFWCADKRHSHRVFQTLESVHQELAAALLEGNTKVRAALDEVIRKDRIVRIAHPCTHFTRAYPLNRFLGILVSRHLEQAHESPRRMNVDLQRIASANPGGHSCDPNQGFLCRDFPHVAHFELSTCEKTGSSAPQFDIYDYIVVRHGINEPDPIKIRLSTGEVSATASPQFNRQLLPYFAF